MYRTILLNDVEKSIKNRLLNIDNSLVQMHISAMIIVNSSVEIEQLKRSNAIVAEVLEKLKKMIEPGITTKELDQVAEEYILLKGAAPAFKGYRGFPATLCISINEEVVHGIPSQRRLKEGDIVSLDVGTKMNGYFGDGAITLPGAKVGQVAERLLQWTERALFF